MLQLVIAIFCSVMSVNAAWIFSRIWLHSVPSLGNWILRIGKLSSSFLQKVLPKLVQVTWKNGLLNAVRLNASVEDKLLTRLSKLRRAISFVVAPVEPSWMDTLGLAIGVGTRSFRFVAYASPCTVSNVLET